MAASLRGGSFALPASRAGPQRFPEVPPESWILRGEATQAGGPGVLVCAPREKQAATPRLRGAGGPAARRPTASPAPATAAGGARLARLSTIVGLRPSGRPSGRLTSGSATS